MFESVLEYTCTATGSCTNGNAAALVLGQSSFTTNTTTQTGLYAPEGVVLDSHGNLWVADRSNCRVLEYSNALITPGDLVVWRPSSDVWYVLKSSANYDRGSAARIQYGMSGDRELMMGPTGCLWCAVTP
jgi:hypothetical protein